MAFELPPLPYDHAALEPTIDEATMKLHHGKHHQAYTDKLNEAQRTTLLSRIPLNRMGAAKDVAAAVAYLGSDEAAWVTGQTLHVNGGMLMV